MQHRESNADPAQRASLFEPPSVIYEEPGFLAATWRNVGIVVWGKQATPSLAKKLEQFSDDLLARNPNGISAIHVITSTAALPDSATRAELDRLTNKYAKDLAVMGTVIEGTGFWASAMTSFITSLHWMSRKPFKVRTASDAADIANWAPPHHAAKTGVRFTPDELGRALGLSRERLSPNSPP
ncbi:MAG TPA: hypothetical protein VHC69_33270 [Polyangiaceae bacterium]|nr:hypothetical protein [Polyangiaceae bacterium]